MKTLIAVPGSWSVLSSGVLEPPHTTQGKSLFTNATSTIVSGDEWPVLGLTEERIQGQTDQDFIKAEASAKHQRAMGQAT
jgi:hypothetical protein